MCDSKLRYRRLGGIGGTQGEHAAVWHPQLWHGIGHQWGAALLVLGTWSVEHMTSAQIAEAQKYNLWGDRCRRAPKLAGTRAGQFVRAIAPLGYQPVPFGPISGTMPARFDSQVTFQTSNDLVSRAQPLC